MRGSEGDIVRFTVDGLLVWPPTMAAFGGFPVAGNLIGPTQGFEIRFGTEGGRPLEEGVTSSELATFIWERGL